MKNINLQRFADIADLFSQKEVLDYTSNRTYKPYLGDSLFPSRRVESLELDELLRDTPIPTIASFSAFDAEAEIGSRSASKLSLELAYIKRKLRIGEKELIALANPRDQAEQNSLTQHVYNDIEKLVQSILSRVEKMSMDVLSTGKVVDEDHVFSADYHVPAAHQADLTKSGAGNITWDSITNDSLDILGYLEAWSDLLDIPATRALTSTKVYRLITTNAKVLQAVYGTTTRALSANDFDAFMQMHNLPIIRTYDNKYDKEGANGKKTATRYFPENRIVLMNDDPIGEKVFGPTPDEVSAIAGTDISASDVGNVFAKVYKSSDDPVGTFSLAAATALPSFAARDEVFQAQVIA